MEDRTAYCQGSRERLLDDRLRPYFIAWKRGVITGRQLNELYYLVKAMIWEQVYSGWCSMDSEDMFQDTWMHIQEVVPKWNEESGTYVSTWLHFVISNWVKTIRIREKRLHDRIVFVDDYAHLNQIPDASQTSLYVRAVRKCMESSFDDSERKIAQLITDPGSDAVAIANSGKKYRRSSLSLADICCITGLTKFQLSEARKRMKEKIENEISNF